MSVLDENTPDLNFKTLEDVRAYSRFFLGHDPQNFQFEFPTPEKWNEFSGRRAVQLEAQLNYFKDIDFSKANTSNIRSSYYRILPKHYTDPLSSVGSDHKSTRFNYKDVDHLKNRVVYFGKTQQCCEAELFHLDYQIEQLKKMQGCPADDLDIKFNHLTEHTIYEYDIKLDNVLILTTKPSCDAINITLGTYQNEWFEVNSEYEIPSSSQILGTLAKRQGYSGIMYTSIRQQIQHNLVVFEENISGLEFKLISRKPFRSTLDLSR